MLFEALLEEQQHICRDYRHVRDSSFFLNMDLDITFTQYFNLWNLRCIKDLIALNHSDIFR